MSSIEHAALISLRHHHRADLLHPCPPASQLSRSSIRLYAIWNDSVGAMLSEPATRGDGNAGDTGSGRTQNHAADPSPRRTPPSLRAPRPSPTVDPWRGRFGRDRSQGGLVETGAWGGGVENAGAATPLGVDCRSLTQTPHRHSGVAESPALHSGSRTPSLRRQSFHAAHIQDAAR
jgi:hypothetical protein